MFIIAENVEKKIKYREQIENCFSRTIKEVTLVKKNKNKSKKNKIKLVESPKLNDGKILIELPIPQIQIYMSSAS